MRFHNPLFGIYKLFFLVVYIHIIFLTKSLRSLSVFNVRKKKPLALRTRAHVKTENSPQGCCDESWVSAVASLPYTDLVASGKTLVFIYRCIVCNLSQVPNTAVNFRKVSASMSKLLPQIKELNTIFLPVELEKFYSL